MNILIACEVSGKVRDAFITKGHNAVSCDLLPSDRPGPHLQKDVLSTLHIHWDMVIAFPPCTALCVSGNRWYSGTKEREEAVEFFRRFLTLDCERICVENPVGVISSRIRPPDQYIQPWMFGHGETKKTGLWLVGLPPLKPTNIVEGREQRIWKMGPSDSRAKDRSETYDGVALAMAEQWG